MLCAPLELPPFDRPPHPLDDPFGAGRAFLISSNKKGPQRGRQETQEAHCSHRPPYGSQEGMTADGPVVRPAQSFVLYEGYLLTAVRYVELNPVRAGLGGYLNKSRHYCIRRVQAEPASRASRRRVARSLDTLCAAGLFCMGPCAGSSARRARTLCSDIFSNVFSHRGHAVAARCSRRG